MSAIRDLFWAVNKVVFWGTSLSFNEVFVKIFKGCSVDLSATLKLSWFSINFIEKAPKFVAQNGRNKRK